MNFSSMRMRVAVAAKFTVTFPNDTSSKGADNAYQGADASAQFDWRGVS